MLSIFLIVLLLSGAFYSGAIARALENSSGFPKMPASVIAVILGACAMIPIGTASIVRISSDEVGIVKKLYFGKSLPSGHLVATHGETGWQAAILAPGSFKISPFFNMLNEVERFPVVHVPSGFYGRVVARDGESLRPEQIMADQWPENDGGKFLDAEYFLTHGGQKGLQLSVLKPGTYAINLALFEVRVGYERNGNDTVSTGDDVYDIKGYRQEQTPLVTAITRVPAGSVGVVRSSVTDLGKNCQQFTAKTDNDGLTATLVPQGCKGIWDASLPPGDYYLQRDAYDVVIVPTRVVTVNFRGGFIKRSIILRINARGDFEQDKQDIQVPVDAGKDEPAIAAKVEGWEVNQEVRVVLQVDPSHAATVVSAVGGLKEIEDRIIIPSIRSNVRNVFGGTVAVIENGQRVTRPTRVLDTIEQRPALEDSILALVREDGRKAGVTIKEIRFGEPAFPPELLLPRQRQQLSDQLAAAYIVEQRAQLERQKTEQARSTADQQGELVKAEIGVKTAQLRQQQRELDGRGERLYSEQAAAGQKAQTDVLGKDAVIKLQQIKLFTDLLASNPQLLTNLRLPQTVVFGGAGLDLSAAAAVLGGNAVPGPRP